MVSFGSLRLPRLPVTRPTDSFRCNTYTSAGMYLFIVYSMKTRKKQRILRSPHLYPSWRTVRGLVYLIVTLVSKDLIPICEMSAFALITSLCKAFYIFICIGRPAFKGVLKLQRSIWFSSAVYNKPRVGFFCWLLPQGQGLSLLL